MPRYLLILAASAALCLGMAWSWWHRPAEQTGPLDIAGVHLRPAKPVAEFSLHQGQGQAQFSPDHLRGNWSFLFFGYTQCPDACPLALVHLNEVERLLTAQDQDADTRFVFVSVDPARDTPKQLAEFVSYFNPRFQGVTGEREQIDTLTQSLGIFYSVPENPEDPQNYLVDHSAVVVLINPNVEMQALFTTPHVPEDIATDFVRIRDRYRIDSDDKS